MLEINGLTVAYGERLALRNFSLSMQEGEIVALVGESGSGKTTAIRSVLGLLPPGGTLTEGTISFEGQQLQGLSSREWKSLRGKKLSMIFQDSGAMLNPIRTVGSQFREYIRAHSALSRQEAAELSGQMLARMGLLTGRQAVCYPGMERDLTANGVTPRMDRSTVVDGKFITGRAPGSAFDFGLALVEALVGAPAAQRVRADTHYQG